MDQKLYKAAKEGYVHRLSGIDGRSITEEEAMRIQDGKFLKRTQHGNNNILHIAAGAGRNTFVAEALRRFPFLSDQVNSQGDTPLLVAARFGHLQVVKTLAEPNNELPMQDHNTATAVESRTNSRSSHHQRDVEEGLVDHQLEQGTVQDNVAIVENGTNSSNISRRQRDVEEGLLDDQLEQATSLENGANSRDMTTALENETNSSSSRRPSDVEEGLDDHQLDVAIPSHWRVTNLEQGTIITIALHEALRNGHQDVARYLLGLKPEMATFDNLAGESPLFLAAESRCELFMSDILLSKRPYSTKGPDGLNALHASRHCCGTIISELIKQNSDLMRKLDNRRKAAIHHAVEANCWVLLHQMLEADPSIALFPDAEGYTALLIASSRGCWKICEKILRFCPESIEARNDKGQHALHLARSWIPTPLGYFGKIPPEIWELVNVGDDEGNTPLHLAVKEDQYVKAILLTSSASIDLGAVNKEGLTALDLCESDWKHINLKNLMWFHLRRQGASRGRHPNEHKFPVGGPGVNIPSRDEDMKPFINTMALIAALIATLTFAAAFTMPGGYDSSPDNLVGVATLANKAALKVFVVSDTLAMCCSVVSLFLLLRAMQVELEVTFSLTNTSVGLVIIALYATLVAFISGVFAVIAPKALSVAIVVCIICSVAPFLFLPVRVERFSFLTLFMPTILIKDFRRSKQNKERMRNRKREQDYVGSLFERGSPDTTYRVSTTDTVAG
ncbi:ankyrin repeat-containing protein At5g02620-like [Rhododendron vialii]|uniref:ankyrin repeat-containing protein At5g02620-like n=1 Tax=Rhododendron vialii TaxID=182163 RepID=UPI00266015BA|nr:ankyrin repeat-containing protein At5g02620-like [Rhododendron vialii]XP_058211194.1 ankyrin repeat-containing protein At5g02620-like [Rhododendron vialii]